MQNIYYSTKQLLICCFFFLISIVWYSCISKTDNQDGADTSCVLPESSSIINEDKDPNVKISINLIHPENLDFGEPMIYSLAENLNEVIITPHSRNYDAFISGTCFEIPRVCGFCLFDGFESVEYLSFDAYIENNSDKPLSINQLFMDVENSETDEEPYLYLGTTEDVSNSMIIVNGSWKNSGTMTWENDLLKEGEEFNGEYDIKNSETMTFEYKLLKKGEEFNGEYDYKKVYNQNFDYILVNFTDDLVKLGYNWEYLKNNYECEGDHIIQAIFPTYSNDDPNEIYQPFEWTENLGGYVGFCRFYGRITFNDSERIVCFNGRISLSTTGEFGAACGYDDSFTAQLRPDGENYKILLPYITTIQPNDVERIKFVVRCDKSSNHKLTLCIKDKDDKIFSSKNIYIHYMMPKHCDKDRGRRNEQE